MSNYDTSGFIAPAGLGQLGGAQESRASQRLREDRIRRQQEQQKAVCAPPDRPYLPSIHERIQRVLSDADRQIEKAQAAQRVAEILGKYPEFGELLDLLERF